MLRRLGVVGKIEQTIFNIFIDIKLGMRKKSKSSINHDKLLKLAIKNPGVQDVAKLYENYSKLSKQIRSLSAIVNPGSTIITTNSSS